MKKIFALACMCLIFSISHICAQNSGFPHGQASDGDVGHVIGSKNIDASDAASAAAKQAIHLPVTAITDDGKGTLMDHGPKPYVMNVKNAAVQNTRYRTTLWTGPNSQMTVMSIPVGEDIGLEMHTKVDQWLRIEQGQGRAQTGPTEDNLTMHQDMEVDDVLFIPAGIFHNIVNTGSVPLKITSVYSPSNHPYNTQQDTAAIAAQEGD